MVDTGIQKLAPAIAKAKAKANVAGNQRVILAGGIVVADTIVGNIHKIDGKQMCPIYLINLYDKNTRY
jgi:hypothetical protein